MSLDREVGGVTCRQVLARLSDYLDDELALDERRQVQAHLGGCQECLRFGGAIGAMVAAVRGRQGAAPGGELPDQVAQRLAARLGGERAGGDSGG